MARDGSGVYTVPPGTEAEPLGTIWSDAYNAFLADIAQDQNDPRPISAGGTGATNATAARTALGVAASGANTDITSVTLSQTGLNVKGGDNNILNIKPTTTYTDTRTLNLTTGDADRTLSMGGNIITAGAFTTTVGGLQFEAHPAGSSVVVPVSGTLATLAGSETLSNKTFTNGLIISGAVCDVTFSETGFGSRHIYVDSGYFLFRTTSGVDGFSMDNSGNASCTGAFSAGSQINTNSGVYALGTISGSTGTFSAGVSATTASFTSDVTITSTAPHIQFAETGVGARHIYVDGGMFLFRNTAGVDMLIHQDNGDTAVGGHFQAVSVNETSDARLKKDVSTIADALDMVKRMRGVRYTRTDTIEHGVGVIAQEMRDVLPEVVREAADEQKTLSVAYGNIVGVLIEAIKQLEARVAALEA